MNKNKMLASTFILLALLGSNLALGQERNYINARSATESGVPPFSGAVQVNEYVIRGGETLYLSGMLGLVNGQVPDDPAEEARLVLDSIKATLEQAGMTMDDLVYVQIFCSDVAHYDAFNAVYRTYFTREFPARAFLGAGTLLFDARFEVQSIAVKR